jgi:hypothetical protein
LSIQTNRALDSNNRTVTQLLGQQTGQAVYAGGMSAPDRRHTDNLPLDELHAVILDEVSRLNHMVVIVHRKTPPNGLYRHLVFSLLFPTGVLIL